LEQLKKWTALAKDFPDSVFVGICLAVVTAMIFSLGIMSGYKPGWGELFALVLFAIICVIKLLNNFATAYLKEKSEMEAKTLTK